MKTGVGSFTGVRPSVNLQVLQTRKRLVATVELPLATFSTTTRTSRLDRHCLDMITSLGPIYRKFVFH